MKIVRVQAYITKTTKPHLSSLLIITIIKYSFLEGIQAMK